MPDNTESYFKVLFEEAHRATLMSRFIEADDICHRLLREPTLPLLYRAGCNLMLSFGDDNPVAFAKEAVNWYEEMYNEVSTDPTDGPHHLALLEQAREAVTDAEGRLAKARENAAGEESDDQTDGEEETGVELPEIEMIPGSEIEQATNVAASSLEGLTDIEAASSSQTAIQIEDSDTAAAGKIASEDED